MKTFFVFFLFFFFLFPHAVFAHSLGQPPYLKVNGAWVTYYPLQVAGVLASSLDIPQDGTSENYLVNKPISFILDTSQLGMPQEIADKATFAWEFGDGTKGSGVTNTHTYKKEGSYVLTMFITLDGSSSQLFETLFLNIIPNSSYKLPKAVITVNGKQAATGINDRLLSDLNNPLQFDASSSKALSSRIVSYTWDFGDGKTLSDTHLTYRFKLPQFLASPILRIKDAHGFVSDTFVTIQNSGKNDPNNVNTDDNYKKHSTPVIPIAMAATFCVLGVLAFVKLRKKDA